MEKRVKIMWKAHWAKMWKDNDIAIQDARIGYRFFSPLWYYNVSICIFIEAPFHFFFRFDFNMV